MKHKLKTYVLESDHDFKKHGVDRHMRVDTGFSGEDREYVDKKSHRTKSTGVVNSKKRIIKGFASTTQKDRVKDVITIDAINKSKDDLLKEGANTVFLNHDTNKPIGRVLKTSIVTQGSKSGLFVEILISKAKDVNNIWTKITEKILNAFSIRLAVKKMEILKDEVTGKIQEFRILSMELFEVSVVGLPCNSGCSITDSSGKSFDINKNVSKPKIKKRRNKVPKKTDTTQQKNVASLVSEAVDAKLDAFKEDMKSMFKYGGKSETEIEIEKAKELLVANGISLKTAEDSTEDSAEAKRIKELELELKTAKGQKEKELTPEELRIKELEEELEEAKNGGKRKGHTEGDEDDDADTGVPSKVLKSADDVDTLKYVLHVMDEKNELAYKDLSDAEKEKAKNIYFEAMYASTAE